MASTQDRKLSTYVRQHSKGFSKLRRSSSVIKELPRHVVSQQTKKLVADKVWYADESGLWNLFKLVDQKNSILTLANLSNNQEITVDIAFNDVFPHNTSVVADMTLLRSLNEPTIVYNLRERYLNRKSHTYMGSVLITSNPFEWYPEPEAHTFVGRARDPDNPHPFAIAGN
jgi:myosin heavy subunit